MFFIKITTLSFLLFITSCETATLLENPKDVLQEQSKQKASEIISSYRKKNGLDKDFSMHGRVTDQWESSLAAYFTPLSEKKEQLEVKLTKESSSYTLKGNETFELNIDSPYKLKAHKLGFWDALYFESLDFYLRIASLVAILPHHYFVSESDNEFVLVFFLSHDKDEINLEDDHFIAYIDKLSFMLNAVQFTYRKLSDSYIGWLVFESINNINGLLYPTTIKIQSQRNADSFDHRLDFVP